MTSALHVTNTDSLLPILAENWISAEAKKLAKCQSPLRLFISICPLLRHLLIYSISIAVNQLWNICNDILPTVLIE